MALTVKTTTSFLSAAAVAAVLVACEGGQVCRVSTHEELAALVSPERCPIILVSGTDLESLDGLDLSVHSTRVQVFSNSLLTNISAASGATELQLSRNPQLRDLNLDLKSAIQAREDVYDRVTLQFDPIDLLPGEGYRPSVDFSPSPIELNLSCISSCVMDLYLADVDGMTIAIDATMTVNLFINEAMDDWQPLQGVGRPVSVRFLGPQDRSVLQEYRDWLAIDGFDGSFELCDIQAIDCEQITTTPVQ